MKIKKYFLAFLGSGFLVRVFSQQQPIPAATNVYIRKNSCSFFSCSSVSSSASSNRPEFDSHGQSHSLCIELPHYGENHSLCNELSCCGEICSLRIEFLLLHRFAPSGRLLGSSWFFLAFPLVSSSCLFPCVPVFACAPLEFFLVLSSFVFVFWLGFSIFSLVLRVFYRFL